MRFCGIGMPKRYGTSKRHGIPGARDHCSTNVLKREDPIAAGLLEGWEAGAGGKEASEEEPRIEAGLTVDHRFYRRFYRRMGKAAG
jgi:hypothetical protein